MTRLQRLSGRAIVLLLSLGLAGQASAQGFKVEATPAGQGVALGESVPWAVLVTSGSGGSFNDPVVLTCDPGTLPAGVTCSFNPASVTPGEKGAVSIATVTAAGSTTPGTYNIDFVGTSGSTTDDQTVSLGVDSPPDFTITMNPVRAVVNQEESVDVQVMVESAVGWTNSVSLGCGTIPNDVTCSFLPPAVVPGRSATLTLQTENTTDTETTVYTVNGITTGAPQLSGSAPSASWTRTRMSRLW